jgi:hypothetical protein
MHKVLLLDVCRGSALSKLTRQKKGGKPKLNPRVKTGRLQWRCCVLYGLQAESLNVVGDDGDEAVLNAIRDSRDEDLVAETRVLSFGRSSVRQYGGCRYL